MEPATVAILSAIGSFIGTFAAMRVHLRYLRRDVDAAHRRLDKINAPGAWEVMRGE